METEQTTVQSRPQTREGPGDLLTVALITREEDRVFLPGALDSIPGWARVVVLETKEEGGPTTRLDILRETEREVLARYHYPRGEWSFARARNKSISLCRTEWILAMDTDERLLRHQTEPLREALETMPHSVGGVKFGVGGWNPTTDMATGAHTFVPQVRLFRLNPAIFWTGSIHEQVSPQIRAAGLTIRESTFALYHEGYEVDRDSLREKAERNLRLLCREYLVDPSQRTLEYIRGTAELLHNFSL